MESRIQNPEVGGRQPEVGGLKPDAGRRNPEGGGRDLGSGIRGIGHERAPARSFEDLIVWQKAHGLVLSIYQLSERFPPKENFALTAQLRRAAMSVPANIAEGFKKRGVRDKLRFLNIAQGSLEECRYFLILARDLGYADVSEIQSCLGSVSRLLEAYHRTILDSEF